MVGGADAGTANALTRLVNGEDVVHTEDLATYPSYQQGDRRSRSLVEIGGARSLLAVALRRMASCWDRLPAIPEEPRPFFQKTDQTPNRLCHPGGHRDGECRDCFPNSASALERQTATLKCWSHQSSPGNLAPVFETMLEKRCGHARHLWNALHL